MSCDVAATTASVEPPPEPASDSRYVSRNVAADAPGFARTNSLTNAPVSTRTGTFV